MEKFIVSARKYRPQTFDTVVGQEHITTTLKNAIRTGHLAHAFLFCGPRGVGKTTCARILAKTINCEDPREDGEACNVCNSCKSFNEGASMNIHELDAASNNSVDDIRALVEQVRFAPQAGKYKVYIIDEVHMLSSSAFNAFLKTLEEPPSYAIFILATTEKHKILPTILSRCQIFDFKRITLQDTVTHLAEIATKEDIKAEETALQLIAQKSEGCMRDALSILDKIVSFTSGTVNYENTVEHLNVLDADYYFKLLDFMTEQDLAGAMLLYDDIDKKGFEGDMVLNGFAEFMRNVLICKDERVAGLLEVVESFKKRYVEAAKKIDAGFIVSALNILNEAEINWKTARNKRLHVELALIKLCYLNQAMQLTANGGGLDKKKIVEGARAIAFKNISPIAVASSPAIQSPRSAKIPDPVNQPIHEPVREAKLIIETPAPSKIVVQEQTMVAAKPQVAEKERSKISSLDSVRKKIAESAAGQKNTDTPLEEESLKKAWSDFIVTLKATKNSAWQSFEAAELKITDDHSFEAIVDDNIYQQFLIKERNNVCSFLQKELNNRKLKFIVKLIESKVKREPTDLPLSSKEQYNKLVEQFPLVKELRDRLRLELDY